MKTLLQINIVMQIIWLVAIVFLLVIPIYLLYLAFFMGVNHLLFSIVLFLIKGKRSKLIIHLIGTCIYFILLYIGVEVVQIDTMVSRDTAQLLFAIPPILLAIHYWYTSFVHLNPFKKQEHNVFDI